MWTLNGAWRPADPWPHQSYRPEIRGFKRANERNIARTRALFVQPDQDLDRLGIWSLNPCAAAG
jgi:hypothetical protein